MFGKDEIKNHIGEWIYESRVLGEEVQNACSKVYEYVKELTIEQALQQGMTAHKGNVLRADSKYIITGWMHFPNKSISI